MKNGFKTFAVQKHFCFGRQQLLCCPARQKKLKIYHVPSSFSVDNSKHRTTHDTGSFSNRKWGLPAIRKGWTTKKNWPQVKVSVCKADQLSSRMHLPSLRYSAPQVFLGLPFSSFSFSSLLFFHFISFHFFFGLTLRQFPACLHSFRSPVSYLLSGLCRQLNFFCLWEVISLVWNVLPSEWAQSPFLAAWPEWPTARKLN